VGAGPFECDILTGCCQVGVDGSANADQSADDEAAPSSAAAVGRGRCGGGRRRLPAARAATAGSPSADYRGHERQLTDDHVVHHDDLDDVARPEDLWRGSGFDRSDGPAGQSAVGCRKRRQIHCDRP
jgi:hypothetical protein